MTCALIRSGLIWSDGVADGGWLADRQDARRARRGWPTVSPAAPQSRTSPSGQLRDCERTAETGILCEVPRVRVPAVEPVVVIDSRLAG